MNVATTKIGIINYPGCMLSAVQGLNEMFMLANDVCEKRGVHRRLSVEVLNLEMIEKSIEVKNNSDEFEILQVVIIPPNIEGDYYLNPDRFFTNWIKKNHALGCIVSSVCAGAFILAETGLLQYRQSTTHWDLAAQFSGLYPEVLLDTNKILVNDGDIITAGGLMSWIDLGLELVAQLASADVMRQLGKILVVDTGLREQRYYRSFSPKLDHGDQEILKAQHYIQANYDKQIMVAELSELCLLGGRTFFRRFVKATGLRPVQYLQRLRIQKACELTETSSFTIDTIAYKVGYEDASAFRKTFVKIVGLTPREFRNRFAGELVE